MSDRNLPVTIPMRPRRLSREFMAVDVPLTPERAQRHLLDTVPCDYLPPSPDFERTGRIEDHHARRIRRQHRRSGALGAAVVVLATLLGLGFGCLFAAVVER